MAAASAPVLDRSGGEARTVTLEVSVFAAGVKPHLLHEAVRAELNAARSGTRGAKTRGQVAGGRSKPWRQKGTGRARAGTTRAVQFTGGGVAFAPQARSFDVKVNRKAYRSALRGALSDHAGRGTIAAIDGETFAGEPSTRAAAQLVAAWQKPLPLLVVATADEQTVVKSFRNLERVLVIEPAELEVSALLWAGSLLVTERALEFVQRRAGAAEADR